VKRTAPERVKDEQVERALKKIRLRRRFSIHFVP
jgi:hypothetical protein